MNFNERLLQLSEYIQLYESLEWLSDKRYNILLKNISTNLFFLEKYRADFYDKHNTLVYNLSKKMSVSKANVEASKEVPELYMLRRIMTAGYRVQDAIRSNISTLNKER